MSASLPHRLLLWVLLAASVIGSGVVGRSQASGADQVASPVRRALLIGINKYQALPNLQGSINDIQLIRQVLITRFGFEKQRIRTLTDEAATRAGIVAALERVAQEAGPGDLVYLHYSGHGSQVQDLNGDEQDDGRDETIVPQDGRTGGVPDITDDELEDILARLRTPHALIVLDSCHSGTATRGVSVQTRSVPPDTRLSLYQKQQAASGTRGVIPTLPTRYVLMTGAAANQEALDGPVDGRYHGFFTYALSRSLSAAEAEATPRQVFLGVERELKRIQAQVGRTSMPEPQLEASPELLDKPLLAASPSPAEESTEPAPSARLAWIEVHQLDGRSVRLVEGASLGALPGAIFAIYPPGETAFRLGQAIALATVTELRGTDAVARLQPTGTAVPAGSRAVALVPPPQPARVPVRLRDLPPNRLKMVEEVLTKDRNEVELVGPGQFARFVLDAKEDKLQIYSADGLQLVESFSMENVNWSAGLASVVIRSANTADLLTLDNPSSHLRAEIRVVADEPPKGARGVAVVADTQASRFHIRRSGEPRTGGNSLQLDVRTNADAYLTVVDVDSQGRVNLLFPNEYQRPAFYPDGKVRGGEPIRLPDSLRQGNQAGFYWDYTPPAGTDTIRLFACSDLLTANKIRQWMVAMRPMVQAGTRGGLAARPSIAASFEHLRQDLARVATRGLNVVPDEPDSSHTGSMLATGQEIPPPSAFPSGPAASDWTATSVTVLVVP